MESSTLSSSERLYDFDTCVLSLGRSRHFRAAPWLVPVASAPPASGRPVEPRLLLEQLVRYCQGCRKGSFRLIIDDPAADHGEESYLAEVLDEIQKQAIRGILIRPCLRSNGPRTYSRSVLERVGQLQGSICFEIPEHYPKEGPEFASHWVEAIRFAYEGAVGVVPVSVHVHASPTMAPAAFLRGLQRVHCTSLDVLWPGSFSSDTPPWSSRFAMSHADYSTSPVYGQWFSDLFKLWWILDNPRIAIESFRRLVGRFDETAARQLRESRRAFAVTTEGEFALPQRLGDDGIAGMVKVGLHLQSVEIEVLERLLAREQDALLSRDVLSVDRRYFSEQVRTILAQDCFQEFFYAGQDGASLEVPGNRGGQAN